MQPTTRSGRLLCTFTTFNNRTLNGLGFAGEFALALGFDVLAVKSLVNDFYQPLLQDGFAEVRRFLGESGLAWVRRATYGSSMGAYAAIHFAPVFDANVVLALSPRFDMTQTRANWWRSAMSAVDDVRKLRRDHVGRNCHYVILYDPMNADRVDVQRYAAVIPAEQLTTVPIRYAGHPVSNFLKEAGILKVLAAAALQEAALPSIVRQVRAARATNSVHLANLGAECFRRGKHKWAYALACRSVTLSPSDWTHHLRASQVAEALGDLKGAERHAISGIAVAPDLPQILLTLARLAYKRNDYGRSLEYVNRGLEAAPGNPQLVALRAIVATPVAAK